MTQNMADLLAARFIGFEGAESAVAAMTETEINEAQAALLAADLIELDARDGDLYATLLAHAILSTLTV